MSPHQFRARRRQKFLTLANWRTNQSWHTTLIAEGQREVESRRRAGDPEPVGESVIFDNHWQDLLLAYTAGESIEALTMPFAAAMRSFARWHIGYGAYVQSRQLASGRPMRGDPSPIDFEDLESFQLAVSFVSVAVLLGNGAAVQELAEWLSRYRGEDMLFESLIEPAVAAPREVNEFFHQQPYDPLLDSVYTAETPEQASRFVRRYLDGWYRAFDGCAWHDGHLVHKEHMSPYNGYWAFEAAAVCVIHDIDDSTFRDHLVYPKDLADWARKNDSIGKLKAAAEAARVGGIRRMRCEGGQPCPQAGYWFTTSQSNSRRQFAAGTPMPDAPASLWGKTIWYWDEDQTTKC